MQFHLLFCLITNQYSFDETYVSNVYIFCHWTHPCAICIVPPGVDGLTLPIILSTSEIKYIVYKCMKLEITVFAIAIFSD